VGSHQLCNRFDRRHHDTVAELPVSLRIADPGRNDERVRASHEPSTFAGSQPPGLILWLTDEDLRAVLVVPSGKRPRLHIIGAELAESETVAGEPMLLSVILEVVVEVFADGVLGQHLVLVVIKEPLPAILANIMLKERLSSVCPVKNLLAKCWRTAFRRFEILPVEWGWFPEAHDDCSFTVLGNPVTAIHDLRVHVVTQFFLETVHDDFEGVAPVVALQVLDVLQKKRLWLMELQDFLDLIEERPLGWVIESVGPVQRVLL